MKVLSIPSSGKIARTVAYVSPYGQIFRALVLPRNTPSLRRSYMRGGFGHLAQAWGRTLDQGQRDRWNLAGPQVMTHPRLGCGPRTGQQHFQAINAARFCIKLPPLLEPPAPVVFAVNPVEQLSIANGAEGVRLLLRVSGPVLEDIMVFGQAPCSAGRSKRRNVSYLGLLRMPQDGLSEVTEMYVARYGEPRPGQKVFIVTVQQKDGWEGFEKETSAIVPDKAAEQQAADTGALTLSVHMHKGCTRDAQGTSALPAPEAQGSATGEAPGGKAAVAGSGGELGDSQSPIADGQLRTKAAVGAREGDGQGPMADGQWGTKAERAAGRLALPGV